MLVLVKDAVIASVILNGIGVTTGGIEVEGNAVVVFDVIGEGQLAVEPEMATSVTGLLTSLLVTVKAELSGIAVELSGSL